MIPEVFLNHSLLQSEISILLLLHEMSNNCIGRMESKFARQRKQVANIGDGKNINRRYILLELVMSVVNEFDLNSE